MYFYINVINACCNVSQVKKALGTVRLLTRLFPFFLEDYYDPISKEVDPFLQPLFWQEPEEV